MKGPCHLSSFDRYTFTVGVKMTDETSQNNELVQVTVTHRFYYTMVMLRQKTQVSNKMLTRVLNSRTSFVIN